MNKLNINNIDDKNNLKIIEKEEHIIKSKKSKIKNNELNNKLKKIKSEYQNKFNYDNSNNDLFNINDKYTKLIKDIKVDTSINIIDEFLNKFNNLKEYLDNINKMNKEMDIYYLKEEEFNNFIINKLDGLDNLDNKKKN